MTARLKARNVFTQRTAPATVRPEFREESPLGGLRGSKKQYTIHALCSATWQDEVIHLANFFSAGCRSPIKSVAAPSNRRKSLNHCARRLALQQATACRPVAE